MDPYHLNFKDKRQLYRAYMPFVKNGGIFIATKNKHELHEELTVTLKIFDEPQEYTVNGKVVWINPDAVHGGLPQGVGIQFTDNEAQELKNKIEALVAGMSANEVTPATM